MDIPYSLRILGTVVCFVVGCAQGSTASTERDDAGAPDQQMTTLDQHMTIPCEDSEVRCDGICRNLAVDPAYCGACDHMCQVGEVCDVGRCVRECSDGATNCGGSCVNTRVDSNNCGACGQRCAGHELCAEGLCASTCGATETYCGDRCVDTQSDGNHCGRCGLSCELGELCATGLCVSSCAPGETSCGMSCVDISTHIAHCGACDRLCGRPHASATCAMGTCRLGTCATGYENCDGNTTNGCERAVSCSAGAACTTSCGSSGTQNCADLCAPTCSPPVEICNARDDDCDGQCDEIGGCRASVYESWDTRLAGGGVGHIYTRSPGEAVIPGRRSVVKTNAFWLYLNNPGGFVSLHRCRRSNGSTNFVADSSCEGAGTAVETLGFMSPTAQCGAVPLYRLYQASATGGDHYFTIDIGERRLAESVGYVFERIVGYVFPVRY